ncbi:NAD(P)-binding domain containing protein [Quillaja saponaria]|uniref:NAD(P)-binding domain containing protein n=1 Tax=Quillaja saponaria TaxID=32244 RepID=A0AAD7PZE7_QUISA|nr:NAD(P)-binding domain containing protein [Quillaja saponaria]
MTGQLSQMHWSETDLVTLGVPIPPTLVNEALTGYWESFANNLVGHIKYVPFIKDAPSWTVGALIGFFGKYSGVKDIYFAPTNSEIGKPLQHVEIFLRDKVNGECLMSLEGATISNGRIGWFALACVNLLLQGKHDINVFLFKTGKDAEAVILSLNDGATTGIKCILVLSRGRKSNQDLVDKLRSKVQFRLDAVDDQKLLPKAKFVITATNASKPVFETNEIVPDAVTLSLGINDLPTDYIERLLTARGHIVADDMVAMESCNIDFLEL